jgi:type IV pilus assembly protein PilV
MLTTKRKPNSSRISLKRNFGVSLIEVLISIVIASIGLLALAGVNVSSIRYTKMSQYRGTATQLAADIAERMRANKTGLGSYDFQDDFATQAALVAPAQACDSYLVTCTAASLADYDLRTWLSTVRDQLPEGAAFIASQPVQSAADVWVVWRDPETANADDSPVNASECPAGLTVAADASIRCSYFRINL